jgi:hypothetical protein
MFESWLQREKIFLSYASEDEERVRTIYRHLLEVGHLPWMAKEDLMAGQVWSQEISKAIKSSDFAIIFFSKAAISKRGFVQRELRLCGAVLASVSLVSRCSEITGNS